MVAFEFLSLYTSACVMDFYISMKFLCNMSGKLRNEVGKCFGPWWRETLEENAAIISGLMY